MVKPVLSITNLQKLFPVKRNLLGRVDEFVHAVDQVSVDIYPKTTFGLVGESGCGKSTLAETLLGLTMPTAGSIKFHGTELSGMGDRDWRERKLRCQIQIVFQDPAEVLSPRKSVEFLIAEPVLINSLYRDLRHARPLISELLQKVKLGDEVLTRFPHQLSGGQRQRVCIARALSVSPDLIILDEPTSALDVSVQAKILNLLAELQEQESLTYLLITHDIRVVEYLCHHVGVMYLGEIVEVIKAEELRDNARHPYSKLLIASSLSSYKAEERGDALAGELPSAINIPQGCRFQSRCPKAQPLCSEVHPELIPLDDGSMCRCHLVTSENL